MQVCIGIDWSEKKHDAVFVNEAAAVLAIVTLEHTPRGLAKLETVCGDLGVDPQDVLVGLETAHNLLIDYLWARNYTQAYVVTPSVVKGSRQRYRQIGWCGAHVPSLPEIPQFCYCLVRKARYIIV